MKYMYTPSLCLIFLFLTTVSCKNAPNTDSSRHNREGAQRLNTPVKTPISNAKTNKVLTFQVIDAPNKTFGYDISVDGKKLIRQTSVPAVPGIEGFKTAAQAEKVALFLIEKMKKSEALPAISLDELKQLGVL